VRAGGRFWAVFPFVAGQQRAATDLTPHHAAQLGATLGAIHHTLARYPAADVRTFPPKMAWDSAHAAAEMRWYEQHIARLPARDPFDQHALTSFAFRRTLLAAGVPSPQAFAYLPAHLLHGDYHERNVFFDDGGRLNAVIDWELAGVGPRAWEIVRTLDVALDAPGDLTAGAPRLRAFLHAYTQHVPLTEAECRAMPELYWAARVHSLWVYEEHYRKGGARTDALAMQDLETLQWWTRHRLDLANTLVDALRTAPHARILTSRDSTGS
jgi:Ser/Thr protein kinase RdoA (MazF antagonist)